MFSIRSICWMVLATTLLAGCGKKSEPPAKSPTPSPPPVTGQAQPPHPAAETSGTETNVLIKPPSQDIPSNTLPVDVSQGVPISAEDDAFTRNLKKLDELEQETEFEEALQLCRTMKKGSHDPDQQRTLGAIMVRLTAERREAPDLREAIKHLSSDDPEYIQAAGKQLLDAGETGQIFLRNVLRKDKDGVAMAAAKLLIELSDVKAFPIFVDQMKKRQSVPLVELMTDALKREINTLATNVLADCHRNILNDAPHFRRRETAGVLVAAFDTRCQRSIDSYNQLVGAPDGFEIIRTYIENLLVSKDTQTMTWACQHGGSLVGCFNAVMGRYYADTEFKSLALERMDSQIRIDNRQFPFPDNRQDNITARWSGYIEVPTNGEYTFYALAETRCVVSVNGQAVVDVQGWTNAQGQIVLPAGLVPFNVDFFQWGGNTRIQVEWSGPNVARQVVGGGALRTPPWEAAALQLRSAIQNLASTNWADMRAAKSILSWSGETGNIFLRDAVRREPDSIAARAAEMLALRRDRRAPAVLIECIEKTPDSPILPVLTSSLCDLAPCFQPRQIHSFFKTMLQDADAFMLPHASALCAILNRVCEGGKDRFNEAVQDSNGYDLLKRHVQQALISSNNTAVMNACEYGAPFAPLLAGLYGRYYLGHQNDDLSSERTIAWLEIPNKQFPLPRQDDISARWTGLLLIEKPGAYEFYSRSDNSANLWIDDRHVVGSWNWDEQKGTLDLQPGPHRVRIDFHQISGNTQVQLAWSATNMAMAKQVLADSVLRTPVWRSALVTLPASINNLTSTNVADARAARAAVAQVQGCGDVFLRNAVRYKPDPVAKAAARFLADRNDALAPPVLIDRIRKAPDSPVVFGLLESLRDLAPHIAPDFVPPLYEAMRKDKSGGMIPEACILCLVLDLTCGGRVDEFNTLVKDSKGYEHLKAYVAQSAVSTSDDVVMRAGGFGAPFVAPLAGVKGSYYLGQQYDELALERLDASVVVQNRAFPLPNNRQDDISARWYGTLLVNQPGEYVFSLLASREANLWIDGKYVLKGWDWQNRSNSIALSKGSHRIRVDYRQDNGDARVQLLWSGPGIAQQAIGADVLRTPLWQSELEKLAPAINSLISTNKAEVRSAKTTLLQAGIAGRLFLRNALRHRPDPVAIKAAGLLAQQYDPESADLLLERILKEPYKSSVQDFLVNFRELARSVSPKVIPSLYEAMSKDARKTMIPEASALCIIFDRTWRANREQFSRLVGDANAYDKLQAYVEAALKSPDTRIIAKACEFGSPFAPSLTGLRGQYFEDQVFETLSVNRLDSQIAIPNRQFPHRQDDLSARWTGVLAISKPADYTFYLLGERTASLYLDGEHVVSSWNWQEQNKTIPLPSGTHAVRVDFQQDAGNSRVELYWSGPESNRQVFAGAPISTPLWSSELERLMGLVAGLATTNEQQVVSITNAIGGFGSFGKVFLLPVVRYETNAAAPRAASLLASWQDVRLADLALDHMKNHPASPAIHGLVNVLGSSVTNVTPEQAAWVCQWVQKDTQFAYPWHAGLLSRLLKDACGGNTNRFNTLVKDPKGFDTIKAYADAIQKQGDKAPPGWTNEYRIVSSP